MLRGSVLALTLLLNLPTLWAALGTQTVSLDSALVRLLVTLPIVAVLLGGVRLAMAARPQPAEKPGPRPAPQPARAESPR
jgi:hypothetical protein